ncbi:fungal-specific transcription factor domain-containing protein [Talaromyces proteolyticus]|uniref:Fungal-specific transcription factor domain-containing protein n=1 Tax=Talaromyces proteolyticus TaxID=1131652 RepID=A0AAD4PW50_9EURO|nr:fungal-specific transcription factor domain-containing protein [Talaromyces proteolyticus]KAH8692113.1 fungal-specific transcription factor domain-containing protein [Talaromyces proteolyticus]
MTTSDSASSRNVASRQKKRKPANRRALSCYLCRKHKLKCDRQIPCHSCIRYQREDQCRENPAPSASARITSRQSPSIIAPGCLPAPPKPGGDSLLEILKFPMKYTVNALVECCQSNSRLDPAYTTLFLHSRFTLPILLPQSMPMGSVLGDSKVTSSSLIPRHIDSKLFWRVQLASLLPPRKLCDRLVSYYVENIDLIYHAIHIPSFQHQYNALWTLNTAEIDLIWLALLLTVISISALMAPKEYVETLGIANSAGHDWAHVWHQASRQALHTGEFELKPTLTQLQVFLCTQIYWLETKNHEILNSALGQAVRNAQAIGLDKNQPGKDRLDTELRRRVWWELVINDTYQAMCLGRPPLIHPSSSEVPKPVHCNDVDVSETTITPHPMEEITDMSASIAQIEVYIVFRRLFEDNGAYNSSYEFVRSIDRQIQDVVSRFPWYFQINNQINLRHVSSMNTIFWQHNSLHIGICLQRIRLNRPFLHARIGESWLVCAKAAQDIFVPYRRMRETHFTGFLGSPRFTSLEYDVYTAAVAVAAFLLVERSLPGLSSKSMVQDIQMVISDLEQVDLRPMLADGVKVLRKMLDLFEKQDHSPDSQARISLVKEIASVFGGEEVAKKYLKQSHNDPLDSTKATTANAASTRTFQSHSGLESGFGAGILSSSEHSSPAMGNSFMTFNDSASIDFEVALEMLSFDQWLDYPMPDGTYAPVDHW